MSNLRGTPLAGLLAVSLAVCACQGPRSGSACKSDLDCGPAATCRAGACVERPAPIAAADPAVSARPAGPALLAPAPAPRPAEPSAQPGRPAAQPAPAARIYAPQGAHISPPRPGERLNLPASPPPNQRSPFVPALGNLPRGADPATYIPPSL